MKADDGHREFSYVAGMAFFGAVITGAYLRHHGYSFYADTMDTVAFWFFLMWAAVKVSSLCSIRSANLTVCVLAGPIETWPYMTRWEFEQALKETEYFVDADGVYTYQMKYHSDVSAYERLQWARLHNKLHA